MNNCNSLGTTLGTIIRNYRKANNLTQSQLASTLSLYGYSIKNGAISTWENDTAVPNAYQFLTLCEILEININHFFSSTGKIIKERNGFRSMGNRWLINIADKIGFCSYDVLDILELVDMGDTYNLITGAGDMWLEKEYCVVVTDSTGIVSIEYDSEAINVYLERI